jgi:hypothetical protein
MFSMALFQPLQLACTELAGGFLQHVANSVIKKRRKEHNSSIGFMP